MTLSIRALMLVMLLPGGSKGGMRRISRRYPRLSPECHAIGEGMHIGCFLRIPKEVLVSFVIVRTLAWGAALRLGRVRFQPSRRTGVGELSG